MKIARNNHGHFYRIISQLILLYAREILHLVKWHWFCSIGAIYFESQVYKILQYRMLKWFWNIHSCVYRDICNDGHGGTMHTYAHIISKHYPWFWNTNIFALTYNYICFELQIYLLRTTDIFALNCRYVCFKLKINFHICIVGHSGTMHKHFRIFDLLWLTPHSIVTQKWADVFPPQQNDI